MPPPALAPTSTLTIETLGNGVEWARFDALGAEYYLNRWMLADYLLLTKTPKRLPTEAYLISAAAVASGHHWRDAQQYPAGPFTHEGFLATIKMKVSGIVEKEEYSPGARLEFSAGILYGPAIRDWHCWRYIQAWWAPEVWEQIGFDYRKFQGNSSGPRPYMETMEFKNSIGLNTVGDCELQTLCDFVQIGIHGAPALDRALRLRARATTEEQMNRAFAKGRRIGFSRIKKVDSLLSHRLKRLLAINMLFYYWETNDPLIKTRSRHINQLGLGGPSESGMSSDLGEAGCIPQPRSVVLTKLGQICKQATRFFKNHPEEFARLEEKCTQEHLYRLDHRLELMEPGYSVRLPSDARRRRNRSSESG